MSKAQLPAPKKTLRPEAPLFTIHIHKRTALALLAGIVLVLLGALLLRTRQENPSAAGPQSYDGQPADAESAQPNDSQQQPSAGGEGTQTADASQSTFGSPASSNEDFGAEPTPYHPRETDGGGKDNAETNPVADLRAPEPVRYAAPAPVAPPQPDSSMDQAQPDANDNDRNQPPEPTPRPTPDSTPSPQPYHGPVDVTGAGATFPAPIYQKWFSEYHQMRHDAKINYSPIGSGGGIAQLQSGTVDFGASDGPMTDEQLARTPFKVFHIPTVLGAVVLTYNIPGVSAAVKFTPDVIADIYLGRIRTWNDPRLAKANPGVWLPEMGIVVVHRTDGSGTTYIFTDYLSKVNADWANGPKKGSSINWPVGIGGKGSDGVAGTVKQTPGSIGYVELVYALANHMSYGLVQNAAGNFVRASLESTTEAAGSVKEMPDDFRVSITNAPGKNSYPICSFTWLLVPVEWPDGNKGRAFVDFLNWMVQEYGGQAMTKEISYAPLPLNVARKVKARIAQIRVNDRKQAQR